MQLARFLHPADGSVAVGILERDQIRPLRGAGGAIRLADLLHDPRGAAEAVGRLDTRAPGLRLDAVRLLAPIDAQEVWGAGVTYQRSKEARKAESESAASFYDRIYTAERPELFFKASPSRVVGPDVAIRVRADSTWTVPEPELALVLSPDLRVVGITIGNDVSARDIEGSNPLYLPQAKVYDACCALGPGVTLASADLPLDDLSIELDIDREGTLVFEGETSTSQMARKFDELLSWLGLDSRFPDGVILLTGTGIVPPDDFGLKAGDVVRITVEGIGTLVNPVVGGPASA